MQHAVAYYRVSTARQGRSGLGIEAQRAAVTRFAEHLPRRARQPDRLHDPKLIQFCRVLVRH